MKLLERVSLVGLILIFGLIVIHAPLTVYAETHLGHALLIKSWKELLMGGLLVVSVVLVSVRRTWGTVVRDPIIWLCTALALIYAVSLEYGQGFKPYAAGLLIDLRYVLYFVLVYRAARLPALRRPLLYVGLAGAVVVIGFGLLQFVLPKDFLSILGYGPATITPYTTIDSYQGLPRLQSTLRGPNPLGAYGLIVVLVGAAAALRMRMKAWQRAGLWGLVAAALVVTYASYSRGAYLGLIVGAVVGAGALIGARAVRSKRVLAIAILIVAVIVGGLYAVRGSTFYSSVLGHDVAGSGPAVDSNEGHSASLKAAVTAIVKRPFGYGTGSTGSASLLGRAGGDIVEDQYLYVAHEAGYGGLAIFLALYVTILVRSFRRRRDPIALGVFVSGIGLAVVGLVLPVFADDTVSMVWFGLAGAVVGQPQIETGGNDEEPVTE